MSSDLDSFADAYSDAFAHTYDNRIIMSWYPRRITQKCMPTDAALELGIGHGRTSLVFGRFFDRHVVVEGSPIIVERFRASAPEQSTLIVEQMFEDYAPDEEFDVVIAGFVLEHVGDPSLIMRRIHSYLRRGGRCFVAVPNARSMHRQLGWHAGMLKDLSALSAGDHELGHLRLFTVNELEELCRSSGFEVVSTEGIFLKPFTTSQLETLQLSSEVETALCRLGVELPDFCCAILTEIRKPEHD